MKYYVMYEYSTDGYRGVHVGYEEYDTWEEADKGRTERINHRGTLMEFYKVSEVFTLTKIWELNKHDEPERRNIQV